MALARLADLCITRERWRKYDPETLKATQKGGPRMSGKAGEAMSRKHSFPCLESDFKSGF
jgi:hypothetical protein